jgi:hypothetical protein
VADSSSCRHLSQIGSSHICLSMEHDFFFIFIITSGVRLSPLGTAATTGLFYQPQMIDDGDCGAISGIKIGKRNRSTRRKPAILSTTNPT